jgi:hypothetical protein
LISVFRIVVSRRTFPQDGARYCTVIDRFIVRVAPAIVAVA